jgi:methyl-accepting chemotaxis protein
MRRFVRLGLSAKAVLFGGVLVMVTTAGVMGAAYWVLDHEFVGKARNDTEADLKTLALAYAKTFHDVTVTLDGDKVLRVEAAAMPSFADHGVVDSAISQAGGTATVFVRDPLTDQFVRRTTNLKKENGERAVGTQLAPDHPAQARVRRGEAYLGRALLFGRSFYTAYQPVFGPDGRPIGLLYVGVPTAYYDNTLAEVIRSMAVIAGLGALAVVLLTTLIVRRALRPLGEVTATLTYLAGGDLAARIAHTDRHDEIGAIARAVGVFRDSAARMRSLEEAERRTVESERRRAADIVGTIRDFERKVADAMTRVTGTIGTLESHASSMRGTAQATKSRAVSAAGAAESASDNIQSVAAATQQVSASVGEIGRQVATSSQIASRAVREAEGSNGRVQALADAARKIGEVVTLIRAIAEQTNLLALNATIEAARAGDAGRGFAVVAAEVKSLASQTAKATGEIAEQIERMQQATDSTVSAIAGISDTIATIDKIATAILSAVEQQSGATQTIAHGVSQAATAASAARREIADVDTVAADTAHASAAVSTTASDMAVELGQLAAEIRAFLGRMRAA